VDPRHPRSELGSGNSRRLHRPPGRSVDGEDGALGVGAEVRGRRCRYNARGRSVGVEARVEAVAAVTRQGTIFLEARLRFLSWAVARVLRLG
jgi:hypothetical protein